MKRIMYQGTTPSQCFPGRTGWEFLPEGYTGGEYSRVCEIHTRYSTHGHGNRKVFASIMEALKDLTEIMKSKNIRQLAVRLPDGSWRILTA